MRHKKVSAKPREAAQFSPGSVAPEGKAFQEVPRKKRRFLNRSSRALLYKYESSQKPPSEWGREVALNP